MLKWLAGALLGPIVNAIAGLFTGWLKTREDETLGQDQQKLADQDAALAEQRRASAAGDAALAGAATADGLRKLEQSDPNNRDNA